MSSQVTEFPSVVDVQWLAAHLGDDDLVVGDVRGPNAHSRGHMVRASSRIEAARVTAGRMQAILSPEPEACSLAPEA